MQLSFTKKKNIRRNFGKLKEGLSIPNLIEVQKNSYDEFLKSKTLEEQINDLSKGIDKLSLSLPKFFLIFFFYVKDNRIYTIMLTKK